MQYKYGLLTGKVIADLQIDLAAAEVTIPFTKNFALNFGEVIQSG